MKPLEPYATVHLPSDSFVTKLHAAWPSFHSAWIHITTHIPRTGHTNSPRVCPADPGGMRPTLLPMRRQKRFHFACCLSPKFWTPPPPRTNPHPGSTGETHDGRNSPCRTNHSPAIGRNGEQLIFVHGPVFGLALEVAQMGEGDLPGPDRHRVLLIVVEQQPLALVLLGEVTLGLWHR